ncbi:unnamed protein product, partial [Symbiodinium sp. KB8]
MPTATAPRVAVAGKDYDPDAVDWNFKWLSLLDLGAAVFLGMSGVNFILGVVLGSFDIARLDRLVYGAYLVVFALIIATTAIAFLSTLRNWAKFCYSWTGRGAAFIFLGFSALSPGSLMYLIVPCIVVLIGVVYCILGCACPIPVPLPFMFAADLIDEHERENPGYIDARRKHNARKAQARLNKVAQKKTEERQALATREHDLARQEAE